MIITDNQTRAIMKFQHLPSGRRYRIPESRLSCYKYLFVPISARFLQHTIGGVSHLCNIQCVIHVIFDMQDLHYNRFTCTDTMLRKNFWLSVVSTAFDLLLAWPCKHVCLMCACICMFVRMVSCWHCSWTEFKAKSPTNYFLF